MITIDATFATNSHILLHLNGSLRSSGLSCRIDFDTPFMANFLITTYQRLKICLDIRVCYESRCIRVVLGME